MADNDTAPLMTEAGVALDGASELPHNHRLRAEALVTKGKTTDPDGMISDELIADTKDRLARETKAEKPKAKSAPKPKAKPKAKAAAPITPEPDNGADDLEKEA